MKESKGTTVRRRYARLPLALALGAMVLTPAMIGVGASTAEASVAARGETSITMRGDARIVGSMTENKNFSAADDTVRKLEHRMRIAMDIKAAGGTSLHTRLSLTDNTYDPWGATNEKPNVATDWLYFRVPVADATVTVGRQVIGWGHRMKVWDARADRLRVDYKVNDEVNLFAYYQKNLESQTYASLAAYQAAVPTATAADFAKDKDSNGYAIGMTYNTADLRIGAQLRHTDEEWTDGKDGQELYGFATLKTGDLTTSVEADFGFGDARKNTQDKRKQAVFLGFDYAMGDTTLKLAGVYAKGTYGGSGHFDKVSMYYNTSGGHRIGHTALGSHSDREYALSIGATHKLSPELTLGGKLAYLNGKNVGADSRKVTALEASMAYKINASTTYHIDGIYAKPSDYTADDDAYWGLSHRFEIRF